MATRPSNRPASRAAFMQPSPTGIERTRLQEVRKNSPLHNK